jgi:hypothetical protein
MRPEGGDSDSGVNRCNAFKKLEAAIADLESAMALDLSQGPVRQLLAQCSNNLAWTLGGRPTSAPGESPSTGPGSSPRR